MHTYDIDTFGTFGSTFEFFDIARDVVGAGSVAALH